MEYAPNGSLDNYLAKHVDHPLSMQQVHQWCLNLAHAVQYMHEQNLVHRDIKAPNCLISQDWVLKLFDFHDAKELVRTVTTEEEGSWPWMAPEVMSERKFSKKSDIYSLTVVYWQPLTRQEPFHEQQNKVQIIWRVCQDEERPPIAQDCPKILEAIISDGWEKSGTKGQILPRFWQGLNKQRFQTAKLKCESHNTCKRNIALALRE